jgi:hypothetical protein
MMIENNREGAFQGTANTISQFAISTASDHGAVVMLTATNYKLSTTLEASQAYINVKLFPLP